MCVLRFSTTLTHGYRRVQCLCVRCWCVRHDSVRCVTWLLNMVTRSGVCVVRLGDDSCVTWLIRMCTVTRSYVYCDSCVCVPWLIHMCDVTHSYVYRDSSICVLWLIRMCVMAYWSVWHDSLTWDMTLWHGTWLFDMGHDSLTWDMTLWHGTWLILRDIIQWYGIELIYRYGIELIYIGYVYVYVYVYASYTYTYTCAYTYPCIRIGVRIRILYEWGHTNSYAAGCTHHWLKHSQTCMSRDMTHSYGTWLVRMGHDSNI